MKFWPDKVTGRALFWPDTGRFWSVICPMTDHYNTHCIVNKQLVNHLERHKLIPDSQFGFRRGRGTADILTALQNEWVQTVGQGGCAHVVAVDIAGAFDRVSHCGVLHKARQAGINGCLLKWLESYLSDRCIKVVVDGQASATQPITAGVPQGSILGPTLFLLYVSDIDTCLSQGVSLCTYADDTTMYSLVKAMPDVSQSTSCLQIALDNLKEWGDRWRIRFEPAKSQRMVIRGRKQLKEEELVSFGGIEVQEATSLKLLGVTFDYGLHFGDHLRQVSVRATQRLGYLRKASRFLDKPARLKVYKGFVRPLLEYAPLVWMGAANHHLNRLDRVQRKALHIIGEGIIVQSLRHRRAVSALTYLYKLHCLTGPRQLVSILPPPDPLSDQPRTRHQHSQASGHSLQLSNALPRSAPDYLRRSFPFCVLHDWNSLPDCVLAKGTQPHLKQVDNFKMSVHKFLMAKNWLLATDSV